MLAQKPQDPAADDDSLAGGTRWDQKEMPFTEHLRELRTRLIIVVATIGVLAVGLFWPSQFVIPYLTHLYFKGITLHAFGPADVVFTEFRFALYGAIVLGLPVLLYQTWMFIVPAFHPRTRRMVYWYVAPAMLLAATGIAFCHFFVLPRVVGALMAMTGQIAEATFGIESTLNFILILLLAFALIFQTPVVMVLMARIGLVNVTMLRKYRRHAAMAILLLGGLGAPDASPFTMMMLATPMYVLYEASIWIIVLLEKSWRRTDAAT